jgi:hypothetical protein
MERAHLLSREVGGGKLSISLSLSLSLSLSRFLVSKKARLVNTSVSHISEMSAALTFEHRAECGRGERERVVTDGETTEYACGVGHNAGHCGCAAWGCVL